MSRRVFYCTDFAGYHPIGVCAIIVADSPAEAARFLKTLLKKHGLEQEKGWKPEMIEISTELKGAIMVNDGEY